MISAANPDCGQALPGDPITTACGGVTNYSDGMPCTAYQGATLYFCLPSCKERFLANPADSCLADNNIATR